MQKVLTSCRSCLLQANIVTATLLIDAICDTYGMLTSAQPAVSQILWKRNAKHPQLIAGFLSSMTDIN